MQGKLLLLAGVAAGYVIGTRQGRAAYDRLTKRVQHLWENEKVQHTVSDAQRFAREKVPVFGDMAADAVDNMKPSRATSASTAGPQPSAGAGLPVS